MKDWKIFDGARAPHLGLRSLPPAPPWRFARPQLKLKPPKQGLRSAEEAHRAGPFIVSEPMKLAVNAALYLRRPLLLTGKPGTGKSTLIAKVANELRLGTVLRWPVSSRSTVRGGVYEYDAVGRLQSGETNPPVEKYLTLGPLGTALMATDWPRALLIDEIDKSDLDFANDLLNVIEEGVYEIPELVRLGESVPTVRDAEKRLVGIPGGRIECRQFPFVVMTSNAERHFPAPFLRRCVRLEIEQPDAKQLTAIVGEHLRQHAKTMPADAVKELIGTFDASRAQKKDVSTDQLLNAVFLTIAMRDQTKRSFDDKELSALRTALLQPLSGPGE
jgi:MoxR-like ATPase